MERWDVRKGFITGSGRVGFGVYVDIGILEPTQLQGENVTVELADRTRDQLLWWNKLLFDRVIAVGIDRDYAEKIVQSANLGLDVIKIETLSLLVQCLVCKLDTDAPGVIATIGNRLRGVGLTAFRTPAKRLLV